MKKTIFLLILILSISSSAFAFPPTPPSGGGQVNLNLLPGTYTNTYLCTYTAVGTLFDCDTDPASLGGSPALDTVANPTGAKTFTLLDNQASALSFGATGAADILKIGTLNAGPGVTVTGFLTTTGQLLSPDGTAGTPSISFASEPTSGWFHPGGGITGLSISGSERLRFSAITGGGLLETLDPGGIGGYASSPTVGSPDVFLTRKGAANWRFGIADAAAPVAQTLSLQGVVTGTSNTAGANFTLIGSTGTGSGAGGSFIFQVAPAGGSGSTPNAPATALTIASDKSATFTAGISATSLSGTAISDSISTTSSTVAASSTAVKAAYDLAYGPPAVQSVTCTDSGNGSHGALTITPTAGPGRVYINLTVADSDGCTITMAETAAVAGTIVTITNISAYHADFADQAGVLKLFGSPFAMAQNETTTLIYTNSQWNEIARATATWTGLTFNVGTASRGLVTDGSGNIEVATTTAAEIGYLNGVTSPTGTGALVLGTNPQISSIELGHASDTTIARVGAGVISVEGVNVVSISGTQTLTNKTLTTPTITNPEVDAHVTADWTAIPANVSNTMIHNCGQAGVAATLTLPTAAAGYAFVATVCEPSLTGTWKFLCSGTDHMTVDEVKGKHYVERLTTKVQGDSVTCWTAKQANDGVSSSATLAIATAADDVKNEAFKFVIAGVGYDKAAVDGTALTGANIPQGKYGGWAFQIGADGTIDVVESADNATGYDSSALAIAAIPAVAASHVRLGTITASKSDAVFIPATTELNAANVTAAIASTAVHTFGYGWNCKSGKTAWTTD